MHCQCTAPEEWRAVVGFEDWYEVSNRGRVRRAKPSCGTRSGHILRPGRNRQRRLYVTLYVRQRGTTRFVHRLVAMAFLGPPPPEHEVNHLDGDPSHNCAGNLEWTTREGQFVHAVAHGLMASGDRNGSRTRPDRVARGERNGPSKLTDAQVAEARGRYAAGGITQRGLASEYGVSLATMHMALKRKTWQHVLA